MGSPQHFGFHVPERCYKLMDELWEKAEKVYEGGRDEMGPLTSTFLLAMSMPIITLPVERIQKHINSPSSGYADDTAINNYAVEKYNKVLRGKLIDAPFFQKGIWRFATTDKSVQLAKTDSDEALDVLNEHDAIVKAENMNFSQWISILRNAFAHGGIKYLNEEGASAVSQPTKMFLFVSAKYSDLHCKENKAKVCRHGGGSEIKHFNMLRIGEREYKDFLYKWVEWLQSIQIDKE